MLILIDGVHKIMYNKGEQVKKKDLEKGLRECGWWFKEHGGKHDAWTNGEMSEFVPRHKEINELLSNKILKKAKKNPPKGG